MMFAMRWLVVQSKSLHSIKTIGVSWAVERCYLLTILSTKPLGRSELKAMFANDDERLWPGDFVNARLLLETRTNVLVVPSSTVQRGPQGLFAWVVNEKNTAQVRKIEIGPTTGNLTVITSGLADDDRVVTDGQYKLQVNSPVLVNTPLPVASRGAE